MIYNSDCPKCKGDGYVLKRVDGYETWAECECVQQGKVERYLKNSGINYQEYADKTLDSFLKNTPESKAMKDMAIRFLKDKNAYGIGYFGRPGTGKTHICIAICQKLTHTRRMPHYYFSYRKEVQRLKAVYYDSEQYNGLMDRWQSCEILFIDDLFKFAIDSKGKVLNQELQIMYEIINTRYINRSMTIFSSEYSVSELSDMDPALGSRIFQMVNPYGMKCEEKNRRITG